MPTGTLVDYRIREAAPGSGVREFFGKNASALWWNHTYEHDDIVAYKLNVL